jgi:VanZ family protein
VRRSSATPLALLYAALIVYASLSPFTGWRSPTTPVPRLGFAYLPWPLYWTAFDAVANLIGYMPLGALGFGAMVRSGWRAPASAVTALLAGTALSLLLESIQHYLPQRVPSGMDLALNAGGTLLGVLIALAVHRLGGIARWQTLRDRWFIERSAGGLALLLLWPIGLLFPVPVPLGLGQVLARLQEFVAGELEGTPLEPWVEGWFDAAVVLTPLSRGTELLAIVLGLLAPCMVAMSIAMPGWRRVPLVIGAAAFGFAATTLSTALNFGPQHAFAWVTPAVPPAWPIGITLALLIALVPRRGAAGIGLVVLTALTAIVAQAPADPYYAQSLQAWEQGRFIRFHGAAQWVGWVWPYAALWYLLARVANRDDRARTRTPERPSAQT